jgi:toxin-antitoxin system PIN domain toxin
LRTALLDVNVLIALLWPAHENHDAAHEWLASRGTRSRWATCPLTQLAFVRIVSNPAFSPDALSPTDASSLLERNVARPAHEFWPDGITLMEAVAPVASRLQEYRQLTDAYLLGLALKHRGVLASFDGGLRALAAGDRGTGLEIVPGPSSRGSKQTSPERDAPGRVGTALPHAGHESVRIQRWRAGEDPARDATAWSARTARN